MIACEEAQEAVSARLDHEPPPLAGPLVDLHLAKCPACREFEATALDIGRRARLRAPRPVPDDLVANLVGLLGPAFPGLAPRRRWNGAPSFGWASTARWAGALVPAAAAVTAISVGVGSHPVLVPSRPPTPCTISLVAHHLQRGG